MIYLFLLLLVINSCSQNEEVEVYNLTVGEIGVNNDKSIYIKKVGNEFLYKENLLCNVGDEKIKCFVFGYSFSYESLKEETILDCKTKISHKTEVYDKENNRKYNSNISKSKIKLLGVHGKKVHSMSYYLQGSNYTGNTYFNSACYHKGRKVYEINATVKVPKNGNKYAKKKADYIN